MIDEKFIPGHTTSGIPESRCPHCGDRLTARDEGEGMLPSPGDLSPCARCGELQVFDEDLKLRRPTVRELLDVQASPLWPALYNIMRHARAHWEASGGR